MTPKRLGSVSVVSSDPVFGDPVFGDPVFGDLVFGAAAVDVVELDTSARDIRRFRFVELVL